MKYIKDELYKLNHSIQGQAGMAIVLMLIILLSTAFIRGNTTETSFLGFMMYMLANIQNVYILIIISIISVTFLFDREFQEKTYIYVFMRSVSWRELFISKVIACLVYMLELLLGIAVISLIIGLVVGNVTTCSELDYTLADSIIRFIGYFLITLISYVFIISLAAVISINIRKQITSIISSTILFFIAIILMICVFNDSTLSFSPFFYLFFSQSALTLTSKEIMAMLVKGIIVISIYSCVPIFFAYKIGNKIRKGEKDV